MSLTLKCPVCEKIYESDDDVLKQDELCCPLCGKNSYAGDFAVMMFCPHCHGKLAVPLDIVNDPALTCPKCDKNFSPTINISLDEDDDMDIFADDDEDEEEKYLFHEGNFFDKYKIIKLLGKGGMGEVYLAEHLFLHRQVALKVMFADTAKNSVFAKRFIREAKIANKIESKNLIGVFDVGIESRTDMLFIAMEYVNGKNLAELIKQNGVFDEQTTLEIAYQVLNALEELEKENIVHRDIKPSNIMIDIDGNIKLADLGIAKSNNHADGDLTLTQESMVFGTPNYASPEQCRSSHNVDTRSDIYSLGATMYHMVCGDAPYNGSTGMEIMLQVLGDKTPKFDKLKNVSAGFVSLLADMLQKDPAKRPQNIAETKERFELLYNGVNIFKYKLRGASKKILPVIKKIGSNIIDFVIYYFKNISWGTIRHIINLIILCILIFVAAAIGYRKRESIVYVWNYITQNGQPQTENVEETQTDEDLQKIIMQRQQLLQQKLEKEKIEQENLRREQLAKEQQKTAETAAAETKTPAPESKNTTADNEKTAAAAADDEKDSPSDAARTDDTTQSDSADVQNKENNTPEQNGEKASPKVNAVDFNAFSASMAMAQQEEKNIIIKKTYPDTLQGRSERCDDRIKMLQEKIQKQPNDRWLREQLTFMLKIRKNIDIQLANRKKAEQIKNNRFNPSVNAQVTAEYQKTVMFTSIIGTEEEENLERIIKLIKRADFDPNLKFPERRYNTTSRITLLEAALMLRSIFPRFHTQANEIIDILLKRNIYDTSLNSKHYPHDLLFNEKVLRYGMDELDPALKSMFSKNKNTLRFLVEIGANVNTKIDGESVLHLAVRHSDYMLVRDMLLAGADISAVDRNGQTPLFWAYKYANDSIIKLLIAVGSDTEYHDYTGNKASDYTHYKDFNDALKRNNIVKIIEILNKYPVLTKEKTYSGTTLLQYAVNIKNINLIKKILALNPDAVITENSIGNNIILSPARTITTTNIPYHERLKALEIFKELINAGIKVDNSIISIMCNRRPMQKMDNIIMKAIEEIIKNPLPDNNALQILYFTYGYSTRLNNKDNIVFFSKTASTVLKNSDVDLSKPMFNGIFNTAAINPYVPIKELDTLLKYKANINAGNNNNALYNLCTNNNFGMNIKERVNRIRYLISKGIKIDVECNGKTIADLKLPNEIKNIPEIRAYLKKKGVH